MMVIRVFIIYLLFFKEIRRFTMHAITAEFLDKKRLCSDRRHHMRVTAEGPHGVVNKLDRRPTRAGFRCVEALGRIIIRGPYPPSNAIIYVHLQL